MKSPIGETVTKDLGTSKLLDVVERLTEAQVPSHSPLQQSLREFIRDARSTNRRRNDVLHGLWAFDHLGRGQRVKQMKKTQPADLEELPIIELKELKLLNRDLDKSREEALHILHQLEEL